MPKLPHDLAKAMAASFATDILPLFRPMDIQCMRGRGVLLADYVYMSTQDGGTFANATMVLSYLKGDSTPQMPFGGPYWSSESLDLFQSWINGGCQP
jgi:hypothetical protein